MYYGIHYEYPFGGMSKRPEWRPKDAEDYKLDLEMIKDTGFNCLRIRIGLDSDLDDVEILINLADELGLKIMFAFATFYVHDDFVKAYPDSKIIGSDGDIVPIDENDLRWQRACQDHPEYRQLRNDLMERCAQRFAGHPAIIAWCVHNEPSNGPIKQPCYCANTLKKYRHYLLELCGSVQEINKRFNTGFADAENIVPPHSYEENKPMWINWREFMANKLSDFLNEGQAIVARYVGPDIPITYNVTEQFYTDSSGQDWWNTKGYNLKSMSMYMDVSEFAVSKDLSDAALLKSFCSEGQQAWVTEFQGGPMPVSDKRTLLTSADIDISMNSIVANNMKAVVIYRWEPLLSGAEPFVNALVEADYYDTERRLGMKNTLLDLHKYSKILDEGHSLKARVAIYFSREQLLYANMKGQTDLFSECMQGAYGLFTDLGYEVAYIVDGFHADCGYDIVAFPYMDDFDGDLNEIKQFVKNGGMAMIDLPAFASMETAQGISQPFGVHCKDKMTLKYLLFSGWDLRECDQANRKFKGYAIDHRITLDNNSDSGSLQYGDNGEYAVMIPGEFEGRLMISGFGFGYSYMKTLHFGIRNYIGDFVTSRVRPDVRITGINQELRPYIEVRVIESKREKLLFVINRCSLKFDVVIELAEGEPIPLEIKPYGSTKLRIDWIKEDIK